MGHTNRRMDGYTSKNSLPKVNSFTYAYREHTFPPPLSLSLDNNFSTPFFFYLLPFFSLCPILPSLLLFLVLQVFLFLSPHSTLFLIFFCPTLCLSFYLSLYLSLPYLSLLHPYFPHSVSISRTQTPTHTHTHTPEHTHMSTWLHGPVPVVSIMIKQE